MISYCKHCGRFCETSNSVLSMGNDYWIHIGSGVAACTLPFDMAEEWKTFATPLNQPLFDPSDGTPLIWLGH